MARSRMNGLMAALAALGFGIGTQAWADAPAAPKGNAQNKNGADAKADRTAKRQEIKAQVGQLRTQLDAGTMTPQAFAAQVDALLGNHFPRMRHGPEARRLAMKRQFFARMADKLGLSDDQRTAARELFQSTMRKVRTARIEAMASVRQTLTADQRTKLDQLRAAHKQNGASKGMQAGKGARLAGPHGKLMEQLQLSDAQKASIKGIRENARTQVRDIRQQARQQFQASLTPDQLQTLQKAKENRGHGRHHAGAGADKSTAS